MYKDDKRILVKDGITKPVKIESGLLVKEYSEEEIEIQNKILELEALAEGIEGYIQQSDLTQYLGIVSKTGRNRGKIAHLTTKQFRKFLGYEPAEKYKGKVRWEYCIDQLASIHNMWDEQFVKEIENLYLMKRELDGIKVSLIYLKDKLA